MIIIEICLNLRVCEAKALQWREVFMDDLIIYVTHMVDHEGHYREYIGHKKTPSKHCNKGISLRSS